MSDKFDIEVRFYQLSPALQPYFTALYSFAISCASDAEVADHLHPEWAAMRFTQSGHVPIAAVVPDPVRTTWPFVISGPTSRAIRFTLRQSRIWGLGLQPAGWARFVDLSASHLADRIIDGLSEKALAPFAPILNEVHESDEDADAIARRIDSHLLALETSAPPLPGKVIPCQQALRDPAIGDVETLADAVGMGRRSLERMCLRYFGFPPKMLLRRQRFLRSLARFMLVSRSSWSQALDLQYYDHAHFVRDFRSFMGMTPTQYAESPHPIIDRIMAQRMVDQGALLQTDMPTVLRYVGAAPAQA